MASSCSSSSARGPSPGARRRRSRTCRGWCSPPGTGRSGPSEAGRRRPCDTGCQYVALGQALYPRHPFPRRPVMPPTTTYTLVGPDGKRYTSVEKGTFGGHRGTKIFGRLDCGAALRAIAVVVTSATECSSLTPPAPRRLAIDRAPFACPTHISSGRSAERKAGSPPGPRDRPSRVECLRQQPGRCAGTDAPTWLIVALIAGVLAVRATCSPSSPALVARRSKPQELLRTQ